MVSRGTQPIMSAISERWPYEPIFPSGTTHMEAWRRCGIGSTGCSTSHGLTETVTDSVWRTMKWCDLERFLWHR